MPCWAGEDGTRGEKEASEERIGESETEGDTRLLVLRGRDERVL